MWRWRNVSEALRIAAGEAAAESVEAVMADRRSEPGAVGECMVFMEVVLLPNAGIVVRV